MASSEPAWYAIDVTVRLAAAAALLVVFAACKGPGHAKVGDALLAQADAHIDAPDEGVTVEVLPDGDVEIPADAKVVKLAVDRDVPSWRVFELVDHIRAQGAEPVLLVGDRHRVKAFELSDEIEDRATAIQAYVDMQGKVCVEAPVNPIEAYCAKRVDRMHVDRAGTREIVRAAHEAWNLDEVALDAPGNLGWGDLVRAIDGARTCCRDEQLAVSVR